MEDKDIPEILSIENKAFPHTRWNKQAFLYEISSKFSFPYGLFVNNKLIGYIIYHIIPPEAHITNFAIAAKYQNKGYGKFLLNFAINKIKELKIKSIFLEVRASNYKAQHIYKKFGFKQVGIRKKYYRNNKEDAIVMALFF